MTTTISNTAKAILNEFKSGHKQQYRKTLTNSITLEAADEDALFCLCFSEYFNRYKYINDTHHEFADQAIAKRYKAWISNIGNYAKAGGDMW